MTLLHPFLLGSIQELENGQMMPSGQARVNCDINRCVKPAVFEMKNPQSSVESRLSEFSLQSFLAGVISKLGSISYCDHSA